MAEWSINDCLDDLRRSVRLADAFKSIVGANPHQRDVLATGSLLLDGFDPQDLADDLGDLHGDGAVLG